MSENIAAGDDEGVISGGLLDGTVEATSANAESDNFGEKAEPIYSYAQLNSKSRNTMGHNWVPARNANAALDSG